MRPLTLMLALCLTAAINVQAQRPHTTDTSSDEEEDTKPTISGHLLDNEQKEPLALVTILYNDHL